MSPGNGPALGGGDDTGVLGALHPFLFSLAQVPQDEKYAPARVLAACIFACALERSGV